MSLFNTNDLIQVREHPHLIGHLAGKNRLTELHSQWILFIWDSTIEKCLQAHRDSYKTTAIDVIGTVYWLLFHPNDRIGIIRKSFTDAAATVDVIKNVMMLPVIRELFKSVYGFYPEFKTCRNGKLEFNFKTTITQEGSVNAYGINNNITGTHLDKIICDDFVILKDRTSQAEREHTKSVIREIRTNIIETGKVVSFIGTPWHKDDAWSILPTPQKYDIYQTRIMTEQQIEDKRVKTTKVLFDINYLLEHTSEEGLLFSNPIYGKWVTSAARIRCVGHLDAAFGGADTNALTFMSRISERPGHVQAIGFHYAGHVNNFLDRIEAEYRKRRCNRLWIETNADKGATGEKLRNRGLNVKDYFEDQNKHIKISTFLYDGWGKIEWDYNTDPEYMEQIVDYQEGNDMDHAPDSASSLWKHEFFEGATGYESLYD